MNQMAYQLISIGMACIIFLVLVYKLIKGDIEFNGNNKPFSYGISDDFIVFVIAIIITGSGLWPLILIMIMYFYFKEKINTKPNKANQRGSK